MRKLRAAGLNDRWLVPGVCIFLAVIVWVVFGQTLGHEFVNYDDDEYVYENPEVVRGLTFQGIIWAFTHVHCSNWHPLTWISHMLDCQIYGLSPGGHHLTNVLLHTATAILLFLVLRRMTGYLWRSAFVAAVFAIHPLRVESVAWVAERKDVLSGLFFMLTLWAYTRYAQGVTGDACRATRTNPTLSPDTRHPSLFYCLVLMFFALGLMCKPMLVTLPLVLLLLDYWPLRRISEFGVRSSELENTLRPQRLTLNSQPCFWRSCPCSDWRSHRVWSRFLPSTKPSSRSRTYRCPCARGMPRSPVWPIWARCSGRRVWRFYTRFRLRGLRFPKWWCPWCCWPAFPRGVFILRGRCPCFLTGWLWYLIMLSPVIGIVQVGAQARADRYTYLPQIGLYLMLAWAAADLCAGWRHRRVVLGGGATVILAALIFCARAQTSYWRNSESLWTHTLACTSDNFIGHNNLGNALFKMGKMDEAIAQFQKALEIKPDFAEACYNLGGAFFQKGDVDEAIAQCQKALQIKPDYAEAHNNLGNALLQKGRVDEAITHFQKALQIIPDYVEAHYNFGLALFQKGKVDEAIGQYQKALQIKPDNPEVHNNLGMALLQKGGVDEAMVHFQKALQIKPDYAKARINLGNALLQKGRVDEAMVHFQKALQIKPDSVDVLNNLAWLLATSPDARIRDGVQAVKYAERACELTHYGMTLLVGTLAAAYAEAGRFDDAIAAAQKACALASAAGEQELLETNRKLLALYRAHQPYHEAPGKFVPAAP